MASNYMKTARKLQMAINKKFKVKILFNTTQWYSDKKQDSINLYTVKRTDWDEDKHKYVNTDLFSTYSQIQLVLWLRDFWYELNGWEVPTDNPVWEQKKQEWKEKHYGGTTRTSGSE